MMTEQRREYWSRWWVPESLFEWMTRKQLLTGWWRWIFAEEVWIPPRHIPDHTCIKGDCREEAFEQGPNTGWFCPRHIWEDRLYHAQYDQESMEQTLVELMLSVPHNVRIKDRGNIVSAISEVKRLRGVYRELSNAHYRMLEEKHRMKELWKQAEAISETRPPC